MDQKTIRKVLLASRILSLLLIAVAVIWRANEKLLLLFLGAAALCALLDIRLMITYFRRNQETESGLARFQAELRQ